jgi:hypothetical protein
MIKAHCFTPEWIQSFKKQKHLARINPPVLEKMIHALSLLQLLSVHGLNFTFKGGTSLVLLLIEARRFSVDIDILTTQSRKEVEDILDKVVANSHFNRWALQEARSYQSRIPKAHYEFNYESNLNKNVHYVLLDILFESPSYPRLLPTPIHAKWIDSQDVIHVNIPSVESILGDKLTAFAPNTIGILFGKNKEQEIIKQLFDISCLFDEAQNLQEVALSFERIAKKELSYRELNIDLSDVLDDIYFTSLLLAKRNRNSEDSDKKKYEELTNGIRRFEGFLISESFKIEDAVYAAGKTAYLVRKLRSVQDSTLEKYHGQDVSKWELAGDFSFLNKLKKLSNKAPFFYWFNALS